MRRRLLCAAVLVLSPALTAAPALAAATPAPQPVVVGPTASPSPTPDAAAIAKEVAMRQQALAAEQAHLAAASQAAAATLQAYQEAQRQADLAVRQVQVEAMLLQQATERTAQAQAQFQSYVGSLYRSGMTDPKMEMVSAILTAPDSSSFFSGLGLADKVGTTESQVVNELTDAQAAQVQAAEQAKVAQRAQRDTAAQALIAKAAADQVVQASAARVASQTAQLVAAHGALAVAKARELSLSKADAIARQRSSAAPAAAVAGAASIPRPTGTCRGGDIRGFPNGMLPEDALCPLWGTSGQVLQADAAAAFNAMSHEYAAQFAAPICVTDSYRSYDEQVSVKAAKPTLAATPGMSNHGWGVATDLCDGIESFTSPQHAWMLANAMRFGWFHPAWAEPTGVKPEPWHWEYAGVSMTGGAPVQAPPPPVKLAELARVSKFQPVTLVR